MKDTLFLIWYQRAPQHPRQYTLWTLANANNFLIHWVFFLSIMCKLIYVWLISYKMIIVLLTALPNEKGYYNFKMFNFSVLFFLMCTDNHVLKRLSNLSFSWNEVGVLCYVWGSFSFLFFFLAHSNFKCLLLFAVLLNLDLPFRALSLDTPGNLYIQYIEVIYLIYNVLYVIYRKYIFSLVNFYSFFAISHSVIN